MQEASGVNTLPLWSPHWWHFHVIKIHLLKLGDRLFLFTKHRDRPSLTLACISVLVYMCLLLFFHPARSKSVIPGEGSPGSTHTGFKKSMEKPLKTGWLKKQRSFVKNWQLRFFVLRGNILTYHKDDKESALQVWESQIKLYCVYIMAIKALKYSFIWMIFLLWSLLYIVVCLLVRCQIAKSTLVLSVKYNGAQIRPFSNKIFFLCTLNFTLKLVNNKRLNSFIFWFNDNKHLTGIDSRT